MSEPGYAGLTFSFGKARSMTPELYFMTVMAAAVTRMWYVIRQELKDCKEDRSQLNKQVGRLNVLITSITHKMGKLEGHLEYNDGRLDQQNVQDKNETIVAVTVEAATPVLDVIVPVETPVPEETPVLDSILPEQTP